MGDIQGILPALLTPFDAQGRLNTAVLRALVRFQMGAGVAGFFVNGGTGEGLLLDPAERKRALEVVLDEAAGQVAVIAHIGALATHAATELAAHAAAAGATAVAAIPPIYFRVDTAALLDYYRAIAEAADGLPVWLYHIPGATGVSITAATFEELFKIEQVQGLKYTAYDFYTMRNLMEMADGRPFTLLSGPDEMCLPALVMGAPGAIGTTYNMLPGHFVRLYEAYKKGDLETAQQMQFAANRVIKAFTSVSSIAALKRIMERMGFDCGLPRRPLRPLTEEEEETLWQALAASPFNRLADIPIEF